ncbi:MAG TPA: hypothetical protein VK177_20130 [Flavobacteriales bacterium]|nr:hypothetical protein [Flavobacteriales bacterium]
MFKITTLFQNSLIILAITLFYKPVTAQLPERCYGRDVVVKDSTIPCCVGLTRVHEVGTGHVYCDAEDSEEGRQAIMWFMIAFPGMLIVFLIFGIKNKMNRKKAAQKQAGNQEL